MPTAALAPVTLDGFELRVLHIPLVSPFTTSFGTATVREVIVVRALTSDGEGWGEVVTQYDPSYSSEYTQGAWDVAQRFLIPALLERRTFSPADVADVLAPVKGHRMPKAGLELAVLDAALRRDGTPLGAHLGAARDRVPSGVSVGIQRDPAALVDAVGAYLDAGYVRIKIKIKPGRDIGDTAAVRDAFGGIPLQVDANSAYTLADADTLAELDRFDLLLIEQPLQDDDLVDHAMLARELKTPVCLDESIVSAKAARDALALGSCSVINIKAGRVGGYLEAVRIHDLAQYAGPTRPEAPLDASATSGGGVGSIPVWCGGMLETGIGRAANAALAALPGFTLPGDVSASSRFYARDIVTEPAVLEDGHVRVPTAPGLGVDIDMAALEDFTVERAVIRR
jgi:O-succinylbenzoate synthase